MGRNSFSERTYEFCYNAEFCNKNSGLLAGHPTLPSLREERDLGYDVKFELENSRYRYSLFLQHKVPSFAKNRRYNNIPSYDAHNGPYYRFEAKKRTT